MMQAEEHQDVLEMTMADFLSEERFKAHDVQSPLKGCIRQSLNRACIHMFRGRTIKEVRVGEFIQRSNSVTQLCNIYWLGKKGRKAFLKMLSAEGIELPDR